MVLMSEVWYSEPGWWLALILGIIGSGITGVLIYRVTRERKQITYQILSDAPIVNIDKRVKDIVRIIYVGSNDEINDANLVSIKIWNSGNTDIKVWSPSDEHIDDFEVPIRFTFEGRTVVSITECETDPPEEVIDDVEHGYYLLAPLPTSDSIGLPHCLLKPLQSISLSVLVKGSKGQIIPSGKLFQGNIKKFDLYGQPTTITVLPKITRPLVTLLLVAIASGLVWLTTILQAPFKTIISAIVAIPVLTLLLFGLIVLVAQPMIFVKNTLQGKTKIKWR
jgi:hypothetical protein